MKRLIMLLFLGLTTSAFGQITITAAQFLAGFTSGQVAGKAYDSQDMNGVPALIATAGASQSWDFGGRVYTEVPVTPGIFQEVFAFPGTAPFANDPDFAPCTHVIKTSLGGSDLSAVWIYVKFTDQGYWMVGDAYDSMGTPKKVNAYVPPKQIYAFPLTYQTTWSSTSDVHTAFAIEGFKVTEAIEARVDGYGDLVLPTRAGKPQHSPSSTNQALRIETKTTQTTIYQSIPISTFVSYDYEWFTLSQYSASISTGEDKTPTSVTYSTPGSSGSVGGASADKSIEVSVGSNPTISETTVSFTLKQSAFTEVGLIDLRGNTVQRVYSGVGVAGENNIPLNVHSLPSGTYFLRIDAGAERAIQKLVIAR